MPAVRNALRSKVIKRKCLVKIDDLRSSLGYSGNRESLLKTDFIIPSFPPCLPYDLYCFTSVHFSCGEETIKQTEPNPLCLTASLDTSSLQAFPSLQALKIILTTLAQRRQDSHNSGRRVPINLTHSKITTLTVVVKIAVDKSRHLYLLGNFGAGLAYLCNRTFYLRRSYAGQGDMIVFTS